MTLKNKITGKIVIAGTGMRKGAKIVKFSGVTIKIDSLFFKKHWEILKAN